MKINIKTDHKKVFHDFDMLKGCFGDTKIMPTDIDCVVEKNNCFLFIEFKIDKQSVPTGQAILLERLSRAQNMTVFVVWHKDCEQHARKEPVAMQILPSNDLIPVDEKGLRERVSKWFEMATSFGANQ